MISLFSPETASGQFALAAGTVTTSVVTPHEIVEGYCCHT